MDYLGSVEKSKNRFELLSQRTRYHPTVPGSHLIVYIFNTGAGTKEARDHVACLGIQDCHYTCYYYLLILRIKLIRNILKYS